MNKTLTTALLTTGLLTLSSASQAAYFDFQQWVADNGEQGFTNSSPFSLTDAGLTLTATAIEKPGGTDSHVYMDDKHNNIIGGMGVCSVLTTNNQCANSGDDNVSIDADGKEILIWDFSKSVTELTLTFGNKDHFDFNNRDVKYNLSDGNGWMTVATNGSASLTILAAGGTDTIKFKAAGANSNNDFYIRNADLTMVPVPAAAWLFGSGLIGLAGIARRKA